MKLLNRTSSNKLLDEIFTNTNVRKVLSTKVDFGENVFISSDFAPWVNIAHYAVYLKICDHLIQIVGNHQRMSFARRLIDITTFFGCPIMF